MMKPFVKTLFLISVLGAPCIAGASTSDSALPLSSDQTLALKDVIHMQTHLQLMKMQAEIKKEKLNLLSIDEKLAQLAQKTGATDSSLQKPLRVLSTGCFQGKCTANVMQGKAQFTVNTGEQINGYDFIKITSGGVMVSENGATHWLGIQGILSKSNHSDVSLPSASASSLSHLPPVGNAQ